MISVVIATTGRPQLIPSLLARLVQQTRRPDCVVLAPAKPGDVPDADLMQQVLSGIQIVVSPCTVGLAKQRNQGLDWLVEHTKTLEAPENIVVFFDDDFVPRADWLENAEHTVMRHRDIVGVTGFVAADGVKGRGLSEAEADKYLSAKQNEAIAIGPIKDATLYGCNMAIRGDVARTYRFDEMLPLYAWQEDYDYSRRIAQEGRVVLTPALVGVHLGVKGGRVSGRRFGYSQIANPYYLLTKGTMGPRKALRLVSGNLMSNLVKSVYPEPYIDRFGRLVGNVLGFRDLVTGHLDPRRITQL